jgi:hypothetical protein
MDLNRIGIAEIANDSLRQEYVRISDLVYHTLGVEVSDGSIFNWLKRNGFKRNKRDFYKPRKTSGQYVDASGYNMVKTDKGWRRNHRILMEVRLGRELQSGELVHHLNLNPSDDRFSNLLLTTRSELSAAYGCGYSRPVNRSYHRREMGKAREVN